MRHVYRLAQLRATLQHCSVAADAMLACDDAMARIAAAVIAGGRSTRMGRDKAMLRVRDGVTLLERQWSVLAALAPGRRLLSCRPGQPLPLAAGVHPVFDDGTRGPLAGLVEVLRVLEPGGRVFVLGVDLGRITATTLRRIAGACPMDGSIGAVPRTSRGIEPLAAVYPRSVLALVEAQLAEGRNLSLNRLARSGVETGLLRWYDVSPREEPEFANWNRPRDVRW